MEEPQLAELHAPAGNRPICSAPPPAPKRKRSTSDMSDESPHKKQKDDTVSVRPTPTPNKYHKDVFHLTKDQDSITTNSPTTLTPIRTSPTLSPPSTPSQAEVVKANQQPPSCRHPRHPAYSGTYTDELCPNCRLRRYTADFEHACARIAEHASTGEWKLTDYKAYKREVQGGWASRTKHHNHNLFGQDVSYRHCKHRLVNCESTLKQLAAAESTWEDNHQDDIDDMSQEEKTQILEHSATSALGLYELALAGGRFEQVENDALEFARWCGDEMATQHVSDDEIPDGAAERIRSIHTSTTSSTDKARSTAALSSILRPSTPKRRRPNTEFRINSTIRVCKEADIDVLRKGALSRDISAATAQPSEVAHKYRPKMPYTHYRQADREPRHDFESFKRSSRYYQPEKWAAAEGIVLVDTSGKLEDDETWLARVQGEQDEAATWDEEDCVEEKRLEELEVMYEARSDARREDSLVVLSACVRRIRTLRSLAPRS